MKKINKRHIDDHADAPLLLNSDELYDSRVTGEVISTNRTEYILKK